jgi:putative hydrolase of the HAD superfamily
MSGWTKTDLFFDLDHTLWDFDRNAAETLSELYEVYNLHRLGIPSSDEFITRYTAHNYALWELYHRGLIDKSTLRKDRFHQTFQDFNVRIADIPSQLELDFVRLCPTKNHVFPGAFEVLTYLSTHYRLHLISNGFYESTQLKLTHSGLLPFFQHIFCSDQIGIHKPNPGIFAHALHESDSHVATSVMIGDSIEADIRGAMNAGWDAIYFNTKGCPPPEDIPFSISSLLELKSIF